ncbi:MAG: hypothetical protein A6F70_09740 [Cycloclasticus sp. symbiont of Bathymodiolus heckerae]|nr:MAG: hypothetical protein A6F70_09740 [Cycloclasticus sp. symbiont of Bathymodiolus heckerae]
MLKRFVVALLLSLFATSWAYAGSKDDPLLWSVDVDRLEIRDVNGDVNGDNALYLNAKTWLGTDLHKVVVKTEMERVHGVTDEAEWQVLYSLPIATYWDFQVGLRQDFKPNPSRTWGVLSIEGLAPGFIDTELSVFIGESGRTEYRVEAKYEMPITQKVTLVSEIELNLSGKNDEEAGVGSGLSETELSFLLNYEINRKLLPYVGVHWTRKFGKTADYARAENEDRNEAVLVIGLSAWF